MYLQSVNPNTVLKATAKEYSDEGEEEGKRKCKQLNYVHHVSGMGERPQGLEGDNKREFYRVIQKLQCSMDLLYHGHVYSMTAPRLAPMFMARHDRSFERRPWSLQEARRPRMRLNKRCRRWFRPLRRVQNELLRIEIRLERIMGRCNGRVTRGRFKRQKSGVKKFRTFFQLLGWCEIERWRSCWSW